MGNIRKRKWIFSSSLWFCAFCHLLKLNETVASGKIGSDERTALDQALLLVELLKTEYRKVVKENDELQAKSILRETDVQTCATTTEKPAQVTMKNHLVTELTTFSRALPFHRGNSRRRFNLFRYRRRHPPAAYFCYDIPRRFYDDEDYSGDQSHTGMGKMRRFDYGDLLGPQPSINQTTTPRVIVSSSTTSISSATTAASTRNVATTSDTTNKAVAQPSSSRINSITTKSDPVDSHISKLKTETFQGSPKIVKAKNTSSSSSYSGTTIMKALIIKQNSSTKRTSTLKKKLMMTKRVSKAKKYSSRYVEPELSQAVAELAKEFRVGFGHRFPASRRGSTKVFLADSTSYPRPLPENHPFCFTNPHNALCRTIV